MYIGKDKEYQEDAWKKKERKWDGNHKFEGKSKGDVKNKNGAKRNKDQIKTYPEIIGWVKRKNNQVGEKNCRW